MATKTLSIDVPTDYADTQSTATHLIGNRLTAARVAWVGVAILTLVLCIAGIKPTIANYHDAIPQLRPLLDQFGISDNLYIAYQLSMSAYVLIVFTAVSLLIFWRKSNDLIAVLFSIEILTIGARNTDFPLNVRDLTQTISAGSLAFMVFSLIGYIVGYWVIGILPNGRFVPRWMRYTFLLWIPLLTIGHVLAMVRRTSAQIFEPIIPLIVILAVIGLIAQVTRYRRTIDVLQRQQMKWLIFGFSVGLAGVFLYRLGNSLLPFIIKQPETIFLISFFTRPISLIALTVIPIALAFSMLRYRLFDIDLIIGRSIVFGALTILLGVVFFAILVMLQQFVHPIIAVIVGAVAIQLLFNPMRRRLQQLVDRHFYKLDSSPAIQTKPDTDQLHNKYLGAYQLQEPLGQGGMAEVYKAHHTALKRPVAIKILYPEHAEDVNFRQRFENEARTAAGLRHPNIVQVYDFGDTQGIYYMVMEYIAGQSLSQYLHQQRKLTLDEVRPIIGDIASALDYAHREKVIHRDVKPSNIMLRAAQTTQSKDDHGTVYHAVLMDFGIARITTAETSGITQTGTIGTLDYMSPEQIISSAGVDARADIYSLGVVAYQMLTGQLPFQAGNLGAAVMAHLNQDPINPREANPDLPQSIADVLLRVLAKTPEERYQTVSEFARALSLD